MGKLNKATFAAAIVLSSGVWASAAERGGSMVYGRFSDSALLDPIRTDANADIWILSNLFDTLLLPTNDGKGIVPGLAKEWKIADDGMSVTLNLRENIKFSDGSPITAEDVQWSLKRAADPDGVWGFLLGSLDDVAAPDPATVILKLKHPDPTILAALTVFNTEILPKKAFEAVAGSNDEEKAKTFSEHPVSSGPFVLESWDHGNDHDTGPQSVLLAAGRGRESAALPGQGRIRGFFPTTRPAS